MRKADTYAWLSAEALPPGSRATSVGLPFACREAAGEGARGPSRAQDAGVWGACPPPPALPIFAAMRAPEVIHNAGDLRGCGKLARIFHRCFWA